jgi:hypothetical protein
MGARQATRTPSEGTIQPSDSIQTRVILFGSLIPAKAAFIAMIAAFVIQVLTKIICHGE